MDIDEIQVRNINSFRVRDCEDRIDRQTKKRDYKGFREIKITLKGDYEWLFNAI